MTAAHYWQDLDGTWYAWVSLPTGDITERFTNKEEATTWLRAKVMESFKERKDENN